MWRLTELQVSDLAGFQYPGNRVIPMPFLGVTEVGLDLWTRQAMLEDIIVLMPGTLHSALPAGPKTRLFDSQNLAQQCHLLMICRLKA